MNLVSSFMLVVSGGLIVAAVMMSRIGYDRSVLSRRTAALYSGVGVGVGVCIFIYYGVSSGNLIESVLTGAIVAVTVGISTYNRYK